jgi:hypothetical protein
MAEPRFALQLNGQELQRDDVNLIAQEAALADDRVLAELLRLAPFDGSRVNRAIVPFGHTGAASGTVAPGPPNGSVFVMPFRAVVGSRTTVPSGAKDAWRDIRSAIYTGSPASLVGTLPLAPNPGAQARWDLVYASLAVDANGASALRFAKDAATKVVSPQAVVTTLVHVVTVSVLVGTPSATPAPPAPPSDAAGAFNIPLAWVRVAPNFGPNSQINPSDICEIAPVVPLSRVLGTQSLRAANRQGGAALSPDRLAQWATAGARPNAFLPSTTVGGETIIAALELSGASNTWSHASGAVIDDSTDWRGRVFRVGAVALMGSLTSFAWQRVANQSVFVPRAQLNLNFNDSQNFTFGQSFVDDGTAFFGGYVGGTVFFAQPTTLKSMAANSRIAVYVDFVSGNMRLFVDGAPELRVLLWIDATCPIPNL